MRGQGPLAYSLYSFRGTMTKKRESNKSEKKSAVAASRVRIGGKFVKLDEDGNVVLPERKEEPAPKEGRLAEKDVLLDTRLISEEDKAIIGTDSKAFFEIMLLRAPTFHQGEKAAKELLRIQHPSLQAVAMKQEVTVTKKELRWSYAPYHGMLERQDETGLEVPEPIEQPTPEESSE